MKWLKRDFIIKFSVIITVLMTILVSMNLLELLDKYVISSHSMVKVSEYEYQDLKELYHYKGNLWENGAVSNDETAKALVAIKEDVREFLDELPSFTGNISVPLVYMRLNSGVDVCATVILSFNEDLPYDISRVSGNDNGVYIGNSYNGYWRGEELRLDSESFKVAGIIRSNHLQMDNSVIVPYAGMNEAAKENFISYLANDILYEQAFSVIFSSNTDSVIENDMRIITEYIGDKGVFSLGNANSDVEEDIEYEKEDTITFYRALKNIVCIVSGIFCFIAVFEAIRLFLNKKKRDIAIMWSLGSKKSEIYKMLIRELGVAILIGIIMAFVCEWLIYVVIMDCKVYTVFAYGTYALLMVLLVSFIMMMGITNGLLRKGIVNEERNQ